MSYQNRQSPKEQIVDFLRYFPQAVVGSLFSVVITAAMFGSILLDLGIYQAVSGAVPVNSFIPYFVTAIVGLALYSTSQNLDKEQEPREDSLSVDADWHEPLSMLKEAWKKTFRSVATTVYVGIIISVSAVLSAYTTEAVAPMLGITLGVLGPMIDMKLSSSQFWFLSPSTLIAFPVFLLLIVVTLPTAILLALSEAIIALSQTLTKIVQKVIATLRKVIDIPESDSASFDPFRRTFNRRQGR